MGLVYETTTLEHIIPKSLKGTRSIFNLALACSTCNNNRKTDCFIATLKAFNRPPDVIARYESYILTYRQIRVFQNWVSELKTTQNPEFLKDRKEILGFYGNILKRYSLKGMLGAAGISHTRPRNSAEECLSSKQVCAGSNPAGDTTTNVECGDSLSKASRI